MRRAVSRSGVLLAALSLSALGCGVRGVTELLVVTDTDLLVPSQLDGIEIEIMPPSGAPVRRSGALFGGEAIALPVSLGVVHRGGPLGPVVITARGLHGTEPVVIRTAEVHFVEGRTLVVTLHLEGSCVGVDCPTDRETCEAGACRTVVLSRDELRDFDGMIPHLPDGGGVCVPLAELCNLADDDCDSRSDEGFDLLVDPLHCGVCDNACPSRARGRAACQAGLCTVACETGYGDCNGDPRDGCEAALNTLSLCGGCGIDCTIAHGAPTCFLGTCDVESCAPGWGDCNTLDIDGCEAPLNDPTSCGSCTPCALPGATASCIGGACGVAACDAGLGDCNASASDGCEATVTSIASCGACGRACPAVARGAPSCTAGACVVGSCTPGFADCDASVSTGCEAPLNTIADCGGCGQACALANAGERCTSSGCEITICDGGWGDCNATAADGCETSLETAADCDACGRTCSDPTPLCAPSAGGRTCADACGGALTTCGAGCVDLESSVAHCGACGRLCAPPNAAGACAGGVCAIAACLPGFGDCNRLAVDGCETRLDSLTSCGACGAACSLAFGSARCDAGRCVLDACVAGHGNCDGDGSTGCEVVLTSAVDCGVCGVACSLPFAAESCATGTCEIVGCDAGRADCDGLVGDGCETSLRTLTDCRACRDVCEVPRASESCASGACVLVACEPGRGNCNATISDGCEAALDSLVNCGGCGVACGPFANATASCATGSCMRTCSAGFADCNGNASDGCEASLASTSSCGACGVTCSAGMPLCGLSGSTLVCQSLCGPSITQCGADCADLLTDERHCGVCGALCAPAGASGVCVAGACRISSCSMGVADCDGAVANGCERSIRTTADCGGCGLVCPARANASASCPTGSCVSTCNAGWGNCDGNATNGCERALNTVTSCGACGTTCASVSSATIACVAGACAIASCSTLRGDCNGIYSDGCERSLRSSDSNCGTCGNVCASWLDCENGVCR